MPRAFSPAHRLLLPLILAMALVATACGPLPRPFQSQPEARSGNELLSLPQARGVQVRSAGATPVGPHSRALLEATAAELREAGIPASTDLQNAGSFVLALSGRLQPLAGPQDRLALAWVLSDAAGAIRRNETRDLLLPDGLWDAGEAGRLRPYLAPAVRPLAESLRPAAASGTQPEAEPASASLPGFPNARLVIGEIVAPGDGAASLSAALRRVLPAGGLPVASAADLGEATAVRLDGRVRLGDTDAGLQPVEIVWTLYHPEEPEPLGSIRQANNVPPGSLDGQWGGIATAVATAAAPGIRDLLEEAGRLRRP